jgi:Rieske 2Fe-2S family protein
MTEGHMTDLHRGVAAPIAASTLERSLRAFGESTMLPAEAYTSQAVLAWELRHFLAGTWLCLGRADELATEVGSPLTQRAVLAGDVPVLLTFGAAGIRAFANTCRHRGHELLPANGTSSRGIAVCPYHAWSYELDGSLHSAPGFRGMERFDPGEHGLVELAAELWHGWLFVQATGDGAPFADHVGALEGLVAAYAPERLQLAARHTYEVAANWKVLTENYHECYHCPLIHPELCQVSPPTSGDNFDLDGAWVGGSMQLRDGMATMSLDGRSAGNAIPGVDQGLVLYLGLLPNLLLSLHPDYVMTHRLLPLAPDRTWVECSWLMLPSSEGTLPDPAYAVTFWDLTNKQDWAACESVQRGLASPHFRPGPFGPAEDAVHQFVTRVGRGYQGIPLHTALT